MVEDWDGVYKRVFHDLPAQALDALCGPTAPDATVTTLPTEFAGTKPRVDVLLAVQSVAGGEEDLVHIEIQSWPDQDFEARLVEYWSRIRIRHGRSPRQVVVLPRGGPPTATSR